MAPVSAIPISLCNVLRASEFMRSLTDIQNVGYGPSALVPRRFRKRSSSFERTFVGDRSQGLSVRKIAETLNVGASTIQRLRVGDKAIKLAPDLSEPLGHLIRLAGVRYEACSACAPAACGERSDFGTATPDSCCHQV